MPKAVTSRARAPRPPRGAGKTRKQADRQAMAQRHQRHRHHRRDIGRNADRKIDAAGRDDQGHAQRHDGGSVKLLTRICTDCRASGRSATPREDESSRMSATGVTQRTRAGPEERRPDDATSRHIRRPPSGWRASAPRPRTGSARPARHSPSSSTHSDSWKPLTRQPMNSTLSIVPPIEGSEPTREDHAHQAGQNNRKQDVAGAGELPLSRAACTMAASAAEQPAPM